MAEAALRLDDLPAPPQAWLPSDGMRAGEVSRFLADSAASADDHLQQARAYASYVDQLRQGLGRLLAERRPVSEPILSLAIDGLLERERATRDRVGTLLPGFRKNIATLAQYSREFAKPWREVFSTWEEAIVGELEALRDSRLRLEVRRADLINAERGAGRVFSSGKGARNYLRSRRR